MSGGRKRRTDAPRPEPATRPPDPIPLEAVDLLAGIAPGVELQTDARPPGIADEATANPAAGGPEVTSVAETGRMLRSGDGTIRRLIRTPVLRPRAGEADAPPHEPERAGVPPRTDEKPGE